MMVNGNEYDDSSDLYPEAVLLDIGIQNIQVKNLSDRGEGFELLIITEEKYLDNILDEEVLED
jgi:hypothetical protein